VVASLQQAVSTLQTENAAQAASITSLQNALSTEVANRIAASASTLASAQAYTDGAVAPLSAKLIHFSRSGNDVFITGANLHIRNGLGHTYQGNLNGLGNLVVGYNESRSEGNVRTGSHNIVLGFNQNYSSAGGIVAGAVNNITNFMASVLGGTGNTAGGIYATVSGGYNNQATGSWSTIGGGRDQVAATQLAHIP
jgi:hypothetical protein